MFSNASVYNKLNNFQNALKPWLLSKIFLKYNNFQFCPFFIFEISPSGTVSSEKESDHFYWAYLWLDYLIKRELTFFCDVVDLTR